MIDFRTEAGNIQNEPGVSCDTGKEKEKLTMMGICQRDIGAKKNCQQPKLEKFEQQNLKKNYIQL